MLKLPENLTPDTFLDRHWQKRPLFMPSALKRVRPSISRNELGWLATFEDVESRIVFIDRGKSKTQYRVENGPFDDDYLRELPRRDWTLLVHDVEKHLPAMRALFAHVPFIPDWRIDDIMVSFAAPGGGVGPHRDNYDVFLCQGTGVRNWRYTARDVRSNPAASNDLALLDEFADGEDHDSTEGDVLYLPPGCAHWGTAKRACISYSIGMRAPQASDFTSALNLKTPKADVFFQDADLMAEEAAPGYISAASTSRACELLGLPASRRDEVALAIGRFATLPKDWLTPQIVTEQQTDGMLELLGNGGKLTAHGMARLAYDDRTVFVNGLSKPLPSQYATLPGKICSRRMLSRTMWKGEEMLGLVRWIISQGFFDIPEET
jgi:50S ribosomal protein L16 3-hydroxylase